MKTFKLFLEQMGDALQRAAQKRQEREALQQERIENAKQQRLATQERLAQQKAKAAESQDSINNQSNIIKQRQADQQAAQREKENQKQKIADQVRQQLQNI